MAKLHDPLWSHWRDKRGGVVGVSSGTVMFDGVPGERVGKCCRVARAGTKKVAGAARAIAYWNAAVVGVWRGLGSDEIDAWNAFAQAFSETDRYGNEIHISGFGWFMRYNSRLAMSGRAVVYSPPGDPLCVFDPVYQVEWDPVLNSIKVVVHPVPGVGENFRVKRALNRPVGEVECPSWMWFYSFCEAWGGDYWIVAGRAELQGGTRRHWFEFRSEDSYGRAGTLVRLSTVTVF